VALPTPPEIREIEPAAALALSLLPEILLGGVAGFTTKSAAAEKELLESRGALPLERLAAATLALGAVADLIWIKQLLS